MLVGARYGFPGESRSRPAEQTAVGGWGPRLAVAASERGAHAVGNPLVALADRSLAGGAISSK